MNEVYAALLGALIGALAGLAGGAFASLASLRASQVAARAPLGQLLHEFVVCLVLLERALRRVAAAEVTAARNDIGAKWNQFAVHQRILCPSERLSVLTNVLRFEIIARIDADPTTTLDLAGQIQEMVTLMVAAHSSHLFRWRASRFEARILADWLASDKSKRLSQDSRSRLAKLAGRTRSSN